MFLPGIETQIRFAIESLLATEGAANVVSATLLWRAVTRPLDYDRNDEDTAQAGTTVTPGTLDFQAFFHQVEHRLSGYQRFMEVQTGDVIIDYLADLALTGKEDVRVRVNGMIYVQKSASSALLETWDVVMGNSGLMKSLLLTPVP